MKFSKSGDGMKIATDCGEFETEQGIYGMEHGGQKEDKVQLFIDHPPFWV